MHIDTSPNLTEAVRSLCLFSLAVRATSSAFSRDMASSSSSGLETVNLEATDPDYDPLFE